MFGGGGGGGFVVQQSLSFPSYRAVGQARAVVVIGAPKPRAFSVRLAATHLLDASPSLTSFDWSKLKFKSLQHARELLKKESGF